MCPGTASTNKQGFPCVTVLFGGETCPDATNMMYASYFSTQEVTSLSVVIGWCSVMFQKLHPQFCFLAATVNSTCKRQCRFVHVHVHTTLSIEMLLLLYLQCMGLTAFLEADGLVLMATNLLGAGTDALDAGQDICRGDTKACVTCRQMDSAASSRDVRGCPHH